MSANRMVVKNIEIPVFPGVIISGELDCPAGKGPWNTVILFHGSGPSDRHATVSVAGETVSRNFELLAVRLVNAGFAVFRYDKRESSLVEEIISDARSVVENISSLEEVAGLYFYGWSQGVQVATQIAKEVPDVKGLILHAGIAEGWSSYFSYILEELVISKFKQLDTDGDGVLHLSDFREFVPVPTSVAFALSVMVLIGFEEGDLRFHQALDPKGQGSFSIQEDWIPLAKTIVKDPTLMKQFAPNAPSENWDGILEDVKAITAPMLVIQGDRDGWVSPKAAEKIAEAGGALADLRVFPGLGHSLSPAISPWDDVGGIMDEKPLAEIEHWLQRVSQKLIHG